MPSNIAEIDLDEETRILQIRLAVHLMRRKERNERLWQDLLRNWPLAAGLVLACLAPWIWDLAATFGLWGERILLPAVALVNCQSQSLRSGVAAIAAQIALYGQFPLEAMVIKLTLRGRVSPGAVGGQLALFHSLAVLLLWLVGNSGA
jgi:hypothetical protein